MNARAAAEVLGLDKRTILRLVRDGRLRTFRTPGGQHRFKRSDIEKLADGNASNESRPSLAAVKRDELEIVNLEVQTRRVKRELSRIEAEDAEQQQQKAETHRSEVLASKRALAEIRSREVREREVCEHARERRAWEGALISAELAKLPDDLPSEVQAQVSNALRAVLADVEPGDPPEIVAVTISGALARPLESWRRINEIQEVVDQAERTLPFLARMVSSPSEWQIKYRAAAADALRDLPDASLSQIRFVLQKQAKRVTEEFERAEAEKQYRQHCHRAVAGVHWRVLDADRTAAEQAVRDAITGLPTDSSQSEIRCAADCALAPFERSKEASQKADVYLIHVSICIEDAGGPNGDWDLGDFFERYTLAERMKKKIRPALIKAIKAGDVEDGEDAEDFIGDAVDRELENE